MHENVTLRMAVPADGAALLAIYAPYVLETAVTFEYEVPSLADFTGRIERVLTRFPYLVAECEGRVVGYAYASAFHPRAAYGWTAEESIYMDRDWRGGGIGSRLYRALEAILRAQGVQNVNACIAYPNPGSLAFHERMGFRVIGRFEQCGFKLGQWYGMVYLEKWLGEHPIPPAPVKPIAAVDVAAILASC